MHIVVILSICALGIDGVLCIYVKSDKAIRCHIMVSDIVEYVITMDSYHELQRKSCMSKLKFYSSVFLAFLLSLWALLWLRGPTIPLEILVTKVDSYYDEISDRDNSLNPTCSGSRRSLRQFKCHWDRHL
jgi:hypothetical protein